MFNLLPGGGLGFSASKEIALGLGAFSSTVIEIPTYVGGGGGGGYVRLFDNAYKSYQDDDNEIIVIVHHIIEVIQ